MQQPNRWDSSSEKSKLRPSFRPFEKLQVKIMSLRTQAQKKSRYSLLQYTDEISAK